MPHPKTHYYYSDKRKKLKIKRAYSESLLILESMISQLKTVTGNLGFDETGHHAYLQVIHESIQEYVDDIKYKKETIENEITKEMEGSETTSSTKNDNKKKKKKHDYLVPAVAAADYE